MDRVTVFNSPSVSDIGHGNFQPPVTICPLIGVLQWRNPVRNRSSGSEEVPSLRGLQDWSKTMQAIFMEPATRLVDGA